MEECKTCGGSKLARDEEGWKECECQTKNRLRYHLKDFLPAPPNLDKIKPIEQSIKNIKMLPKKAIVPHLPEDYWKTFFVYYLTKHNFIDSFVCLTTYQLIDRFLETVEGETLYGLPQKMIVILHGFSNIGNKQEFNILGQFVDTYSDRHILAYSDSRTPGQFLSTLIPRGFKKV